MILPFSTQINGKPTCFPEKIITSLLDCQIISSYEAKERMESRVCIKDGYYFDIDFDNSKLHKPKPHTIREDKNDRWQPGVMIDFFINARQKNMFRFAPRIPVVSTQLIIISNSCNGFKVSIDGRHLEKNEIEILAINDGFENVIDFQNYFIERLKNCFFKGKIIHWTDLKY